MRVINLFFMGYAVLLAQSALAHGPEPVPLQNVPIPPVPGLLDGADPVVVDKNAAIALGKALFWDVSVGSDGMACASCHFHAGADRRVKNQINPGQKGAQASGQTFERLPSGTGAGGANYALRLGDFPTHQFSNPLDKTSALLFSSDDVVSSSGTFAGTFKGASQFAGKNDDCSRGVDPVFHVGSVGTRRVEPRNTPTVINAVFNHRNFWDGRANNVFNGSSPWGDRDPNAGVWVKVGARTAVKQRLHLINSSLASQATGPVLNDAEMSCRQRAWPDVGRKLLLRQPLQGQKVHHQDSVLGPYSLSAPGNLRPGLRTTYKNLITKAFNPKYWAFSGVGPFGKPPGKPAYNQMEANFSMFFGLALQLYEGTLVSDQAPIDLSPRNAADYKPTWEGLGKSAAEVASLKNGFEVYIANHCNLCHGGPALTTNAIVTNSALVTPAPGKFYGPSHSQRAYGPDALGANAAAAVAGITPHGNVVDRDSGVSGVYKLVDFGFAVTGVGDPAADAGVGGVDDFGKPLSFSAQYVQYLLDNPAGVHDPGVNQVKACDFLFPLGFNIPDANDDVLTAADGVVPDGSKEGSPRNTGCRTAADFAGNDAYIPTAAAAAANLSNPRKMGVATQASFKIPGLRNIELTGPYMHNGGLATLEQVVEFYSRHGNVENGDIQNLVGSVFLSASARNRADLVAFMKSFTDERVRYERAPFDHPELAIPDGHLGGNQSATAGNPLGAGLAKEGFLVLPAVGAGGSAAPLLPFESYLAP